MWVLFCAFQQSRQHLVNFNLHTWKARFSADLASLRIWNTSVVFAIFVILLEVFNVDCDLNVTDYRVIIFTTVKCDIILTPVSQFFGSIIKDSWIFQLIWYPKVCIEARDSKIGLSSAPSVKNVYVSCCLTPKIRY